MDESFKYVSYFAVTVSVHALTCIFFDSLCIDLRLAIKHCVWLHTVMYCAFDMRCEFMFFFINTLIININPPMGT